jgi:post-segregation antitoxin (ccd killing protein)
MTTTVQVSKELMQQILAIQLDMKYSAFVNLALKNEIERRKQGDLFRAAKE